MISKKLTLALLAALAAIALYVCFLIVAPFLQPFVTALILAISFLPLHLKVEAKVRGSNRAATISLLIIILAVLIPIGTVIVKAVAESSVLVASIQRHSAETGGLTGYADRQLEGAIAWAGKYVDLSKLDVRGRILSRLNAATGDLVSGMGTILGDVTAFVMNSIIVLVIMFFLFRDGRAVYAAIARILPLTNTQMDRITTGFSDTVQASMYGIMAVAIAQAVLQGLAFWVLGIPAAVMWGVLTAFASLIPIVGIGVIWIPAAIWLVMIGSWGKALLLFLWCAGVVGTVDNVLRPYVMSGRVEMPPVLLLFALLGGAQAFGVIGLFAGPVILALTRTLFQLIGEELSELGVMRSPQDT